MGKLSDAGDALAQEAHENRFRGWLAVNPILDFVPVIVALAHLVLRLADGGDHHFTVHSHNGALLLDGLLDVRRKRVNPLHRRRALQWIDTLPPDIQKAIHEKRAIEIRKAHVSTPV